MGTDFQYQDSNAWFKNMDKLIKYVNKKQDNGSDVNVFYSTPSCYLQSVYQSGKTFTTKTDDFFPYGMDPHSYFTGFFTSRPAIKRYERVGNNFLQVCKQIDVLSKLNENFDQEISYLREAMGILQHHDAVSGTEKQHVANNYALKLSKGIEKCKEVLNKGFETLLPKPESKVSVNQLFCDSLNISSCAITESNDSIAVTVYNPIGRPVSQSIRLPITNKVYEVFDPNGKSVAASIVPIPDSVQNIPGRMSKATTELVFQVDLPALGFATYLVKQNSSQSSSKASIVTKISQTFSLKAKSFSVLFESDGSLSGIQLSNGNVVKVRQEFEYYKAMKGDNKKSETRASGAYVFRPDGQSPFSVGKVVESNLVENEFAKEVHQKLNSYIAQVIRVYPNEDFVEFDYVVGPIPVEDKTGKEIVSRFDSNLTSNGVFYTDANGRQIMKRVRNFRPTWNYTITEPISGNYYPVNSRIFLRDEKQDIQMTVLNDRSQGGSSSVDGSVELMVHRRLLYDDGFGVEEPLSEPGFDGKGLVIRGKHWLLFSSIKDAAKKHRDLAQRIFLEPLITFSSYKSESDYFKNFQTYYSGLLNPLPKNVHLLTLEQWKNDSYLLRLEHFYQTNDDPDGLSMPVTVDLKNLFKEFVVSEAVEMTLGGNQLLSSAKRLEFKIYETNQNEPKNYEFDIKNLSVTLTPMQIKTFVIKVKSNARF
jgi:lysosomal alpha-mannosidase